MANIDELRRKATALRKLLGEVEEIPGVVSTSERAKDRERKRIMREQERQIWIPACADPARRAELEADTIEWLHYYFHLTFTYRFTPQQRDMIHSIDHAAEFGGDQAVAASRGEGKTSIGECVATKAVLSGQCRFVVIFSATGGDAQHILDSIKSREEQGLEQNARLALDYPEVCVPILALENVPNRAHYQIIGGVTPTGKEFGPQPSRFSWCGREITLPTVPGSAASGAVIATRGLDAAVRGIKIHGRRPDLAIIDDPDTEETVHNEELADKLEKKIDLNIAGLAGQKRRLARVMLTTIRRKNTVSDKFTDPKTKPSWNGRRYRFLIKPPERMDLWEEYITLRQAGMEGGDRFARRAHALYIDDRELMDEGAEVANEHRFDGMTLADGTQYEVSSLQRYFNLVSDIGIVAVQTEYDNDPPEEAGLIESGITAHRIQKQVSGYGRQIIPPGVVKITQGIDVRKVALHWCVRAWREDATGYTIDYGIEEVFGREGGDEGLDRALGTAIRSRMEYIDTNPYKTVGGDTMPVDLTLIDAGWRTDAIYHACKQIGQQIIKPSMGFGRSAGCTSANFNAPVKRSRDRKPGDGWFMSRRPKGIWLVAMDSDRWKAWEHDRWMTPTDKPGTMFMWGEGADEPTRLSWDEKAHHSFARHIVSEVEVEEVIKGILKRRWKAKSNNNHWLDASYAADVAANMVGIKLLKDQKPGDPDADKSGWFERQQKKGRR